MHVMQANTRFVLCVLLEKDTRAATVPLANRGTYLVDLSGAGGDEKRHGCLQSLICGLLCNTGRLCHVLVAGVGAATNQGRLHSAARKAARSH